MSVERSDLAPAQTAWALGGILALVTTACAVVAAFLLASGGLREPSPRGPVLRAVPLLQASERSDRAAIEQRTMARLRGRYGGVPIEEAMQRTAAAGWDAKP